jgi:16S rRNA (uracil1498-N3)-methyltransferase
MNSDRARQRLFVETNLSAGTLVKLDRARANYLVNVLRMRSRDGVLVFDGANGEWMAELTRIDRRSWGLAVGERQRAQTAKPDLRYLFAPLKHGRLDYMVQKAVEMGAGRLTPVLTQYAQVKRVNLDRMKANAIEAAEQCGLLAVPGIDALQPLAQLLAAWPKNETERRIVYCDEEVGGIDPIAALRRIKDAGLAILVGPEGGFAPKERELLRSLPFVTPIGLGPRILRADTAAVAAFALVQAVIGDWRAGGE